MIIGECSRDPARFLTEVVFYDNLEVGFCMYDNECADHRKKGIKMAALATPKGSSYVVKKECAKTILESKSTPSSEAKIRERAQLFKVNNLKQDG